MMVKQKEITMPKISVIIPTYNRPNDLKEVLNCLQSQTIKPYEVIIVDDSDNDETQKLIEKFRETFEKDNIKLKYIKNTKKKSLTVARNVGIENTSKETEFVLFLDDDVILPRDYLEKIIEILCEDSEIVMVSAIDKIGYDLIKRDINNPSKKWIKIFENVFNAFKTTSFILMTYITLARSEEIGVTEIPVKYVSGCNFLIKKDVLEKYDLKFDENLSKYSYREDILFSSNVTRKVSNKKILLTNRTFVIHKQSPIARDYEHRKELIWRQYAYTHFAILQSFSLHARLALLWAIIGEMILESIKVFGNTRSLVKTCKEVFKEVVILIRSNALTYGILFPKKLKYVV